MDDSARLRTRFSSALSGVASDPRRLVVAVAAVALLVRLVSLGGRVAHFDEGRVAYWALHYLETGEISYRYIVHGPLIQYVDAALFGLLGPSDAVARLPVAGGGGLLPLAALLFREHLRDEELVALAALLAFNPVLLYYSRFLRSTLLVAAFAFVAFGLLVRAVDTRRVRYVYAASALVALAFAAKENALVYLLVWVGATALLVDHELFRPRAADTGVDVLRRHGRRAVAAVRARDRRLLRLGCHIVGVVGVAALVTLFFFAPRTPTGSEAVGLWEAVARPRLFPAVIDVTVADMQNGLAYWFGGTTEPGCHEESVVTAYVCFLGRFLETLAVAAGPLTVFALGGFLVERYATPRPRAVVLFAAYWGLVSVVGYPLGTDIYGAWITVNALVPLAVPAAVGLGFVFRRGREALASGDRLRAVVVACVLLLVVGQVGATAATTVYLQPQSEENPLVQYAQPIGDVRPAFDSLSTGAGGAGTDRDADTGVDVVFYGETFVTDSGESTIPPPCADLQRALPLQWYVARADLNATCAADRAALAEIREEGEPALVVSTTEDADPLYATLDGYGTRTVDLRAPGRETVLFVDRRRNASEKPTRLTRGARSGGFPGVDTSFDGRSASSPSGCAVDRSETLTKHGFVYGSSTVVHSMCYLN
ncbi:flippase activity-associated protein Agl23 [Salinigranum salinum]|uniref:flippase activity-associated protein Agl23 n=1 Tax=Salinigranum salinum TaxID=1364937 RepID=UPI0012609A52|nr:flippase activity-associated protein Agl23 [Salinigranum salinum]